MKKQTLVLHAAITAALGLMALNAQATTTSATATVFAKEILQGTTPNATALTLPNLTVVTNVAIPANSTIYVYVKLNGASLSAQPVVTPAINTSILSDSDGTGTVAAGAALTTAPVSLGTTTGSANPTALAAGVDYIVVKMTTNAGVYGVGATLVTISGLAVNNATALLTSAITGSASIGIGAPTSRFGALPASASNYDAASTATNLATSAQGITVASVGATSATAKIDLTAATPSTLFTGAATTTIVDLGSYTATNGTAKNAAAATYAIATDTLSGTVTSTAGAFAAMGTSGQFWVTTTANGCAAGLPAAGALNLAQSAVFATTAAAAAATSVPLVSTGANAPVSGTVYRLCMSISGTIAMTPFTPSATFSLNKGTGTATDSADVTAVTAMQTLAYNGSSVDLLNYIPAAVTGYQQTVRIINTGTVSATPFIALVDETTGMAGTAVSTGVSIPAGGVVRLSQATVEGLVGAQAANVRPRLRITAATNGMKVQSFFNNANGAYTNLSGTE